MVAPPASAGIHLALVRNARWKPNGVMDYARSVRKYKIAPTPLTAVFWLEGKLMHREKHQHRPKKTRRISMPGFKSGQNTAPNDPPSGGDAEVPANDVQQDLEYVVPVTIGTPGNTLNLDFDTGSSDLWVWSTLLKASASNLKGHNLYNPTQSKTAKAESNLKWSISYGDGSSASGSVYLDEIVLGSSSSRIAIPNQAVEVATKLSSSFLTESDSDGLLGLAFPALNTVTPKPQKVYADAEHDRRRPGPAADLHRQARQAGQRGLLHVRLHRQHGPARRRGDRVHGRRQFQRLLGVPLSGRPDRRHRPHHGRGQHRDRRHRTTLILLDDATVEAIYGAVPGAKLDNNQGGYVLPSDASPPAVSFAVGDAENLFTIAGEDLKFADAGSGMSFGAIQSRGQNPQDILGDVFLKRVYAVFDQTPGNPRIGFGQRALD